MGLLDYDFLELAERVQQGLDRLAANYLASHHAIVRRDMVDFHGREHLDFEVEYAGHRLRVRQVGFPLPIGETGQPRLEEFESLFDGRPSREIPRDELAAWLAALPSGRLAAAPVEPQPDPSNPFLHTPRAAGASQPSRNPFLEEQRAKQPRANPLLEERSPEAAKRKALEWLSGGEEVSPS